VAVIVEEIALLREILGDEHDIGPRHLALLGDIGLGHALGAVDDVARPLGKPRIEAAIESDGRKQCHDQRRHRGKQAEQRHDPDMEARTGKLLAPCRQKAPDLPGDQQRHQRHQHPVHPQEQDDDLARRLQRRQAGQDDEGREPAENREQDQRHAKARRPGRLARIDRLEQAPPILAHRQLLVVQRDRHPRRRPQLFSTRICHAGNKPRPTSGRPSYASGHEIERSVAETQQKLW
jgi:hypothetical protein